MRIYLLLFRLTGLFITVVLWKICTSSFGLNGWVKNQFGWSGGWVMGLEVFLHSRASSSTEPWMQTNS